MQTVYVETGVIEGEPDWGFAAIVTVGPLNGGQTECVCVDRVPLDDGGFRTSVHKIEGSRRCDPFKDTESVRFEVRPGVYHVAGYGSNMKLGVDKDGTITVYERATIDDLIDRICDFEPEASVVSVVEKALREAGGRGAFELSLEDFAKK